MDTKNLSGILAEFEKQAENDRTELNEVKATMIVNWGGQREGNPKLLDGTEKTANQMFVKIINYYHKTPFFRIGQKVKYEGLDYWVVEDKGMSRVHISNGKPKSHHEYKDWWVHRDDLTIK